MIHYQLLCKDDHAFDGWFRNSDAFDAQATGGLIACPSCGETKIRRALMAPAVPRKGRIVAPGKTQIGASGAAPGEPSIGAGATPPEPQATAGAVLPDQVRAMLQRLRSEVEKNCEHVGPRFAEEARAIHNGETEARPIYGETTPAQAEALADDGIEVARIPWLPRADG